MAKDIWTTKDGYHIQDVLALGRCVVCGRLARQKQIEGEFACDDKNCQTQLKMALVILDKQGIKL